MKIYTLAFKAALYCMASVSFGLMVLLYSHQGVVEALRRQNQLLHSIVTLQQQKIELMGENCESTHMIEGLCEYTLTTVVERLGIEDQLQPVLSSAVWRRLRERVAQRGGIGGD